MRQERYRVIENQYWAHYGVDSREECLLDAPGAGTKVRAQILGEGPPVVFVHGGPAAGTLWAPLVAVLRGRYRCIVIDRPGCGLSPALDYHQASFPEIAVRVLGDTLDALELPKAHFVASSLGGAWTLWFQAARPERVERVVMMSAPAFLPDATKDAYTFLRVLGLPVIGALLCHLPQNMKGIDSSFRSMGHGASIDAGHFPGVFYDFCASMYRDTDTLSNDRRAVQKGVSWSGSRREVLLTDDLLRSIPHRVHFHWGSEDPFGSVPAARRIAALMPDATLEVQDGFGHLPWLDDPERAARAVGDALGAESVAEPPA